MTLIITVVTRDEIHRSSDNRLSDPAGLLSYPIPSTKTVDLFMAEWRGFVSYAGVGSWGKSTSEWIMEWLQGREALTFEQVVQEVSAHGSGWLERLRRNQRESDFRPHTFIVAGFPDHSARVSVISNFEKIGLPSRAVADKELATSTATVSHGALVLVNGSVGSGVARQQRRMLQRLAAQPDVDGGRVRAALTRLNETAAAASRGSISPTCVAQSVSRSGHGFSGPLPAGAKIRTMMNGIDVGALVESAASELFGEGQSVVQTASFHSPSSGSGYEPAACEPVVSAKHDDSVSWPVRTLGPVGMNTSSFAFGANRHGLLVGHGNRRHGDPVQACIWESADPRFLNVDSAITSRCMSVNDHGIACGEIDRMVVGGAFACSWDATGDLTLLEDLGGDAGALDIDNEGIICGWVSTSLTERGQLHYLPASWGEDGLTTVDLPHGVWGQAVARSARGTILVALHRGGSMWAALWRDDGIHDCAPVLDFFVPVGLTDQDVVLGWTRGTDGVPWCAAWSDGAFAVMDMPSNHVMTAASASGVTAGWTDFAGLRRAWVREASGELHYLPGLAHHSPHICQVTDEFAAGAAGSDVGSHAVLWSAVPDPESLAVRA